MIVAGDRQHAAVLPGAGGIGMLEHVAAAIHAGPLAVPHAEDAVMPGAGRQVDLLRAPQRRGCKVFIDAGLEHDLALRQMRLGFPQRLVEPPERRTAVAGNVTGGVQPGQRVALALQQQQSNQGLSAGEKDPALVEGIFVLEGDAAQWRVHGCS